MPNLIDNQLFSPFDSNPEVQDKAYSYKALPKLLDLITSYSEIVQRRALYGLGSLLRGVGRAVVIEEFIAMGGIERVTSSSEGVSDSVIIKTLTLFTDLLLEIEVSAVVVSLYIGK